MQYSDDNFARQPPAAYTFLPGPGKSQREARSNSERIVGQREL